MFDHLYIVADGSCMYQGPVSSLVPFLQSQNLLCPSYHNPADFGKLFNIDSLSTLQFVSSILIANFVNFLVLNFWIVMDVAAGEYGQVLGQLVASVENGRLIYHEETAESGSATPDSSCITTPTISQGQSVSM